jgi:hypothetical protein
MEPFIGRVFEIGAKSWHVIVPSERHFFVHVSRRIFAFLPYGLQHRPRFVDARLLCRHANADAVDRAAARILRLDGGQDRLSARPSVGVGAYS